MINIYEDALRHTDAELIEWVYRCIVKTNRLFHESIEQKNEWEIGVCLSNYEIIETMLKKIHERNQERLGKASADVL